MRWWGQLLDNLTFLYVNLRKIYVAPPPLPWYNMPEFSGTEQAAVSHG